MQQEKAAWDEQQEKITRSIVLQTGQEARERSAEVALLREKLQHVETENTNLKLQIEEAQEECRVYAEAARSVDDATAAQLQDRDVAIATLVKQLRTQDNIVAGMRQEIEQLQLVAACSTKADEEASEEVKRLKEEAQVFAGQVIVGAVWSATVTLKEQVAVLPAASVAVRVTT